jgi:hypothetical protein
MINVACEIHFIAGLEMTATSANEQHARNNHAGPTVIVGWTFAACLGPPDLAVFL